MPLEEALQSGEKYTDIDGASSVQPAVRREAGSFQCIVRRPSGDVCASMITVRLATLGDVRRMTTALVSP